MLPSWKHYEMFGKLLMSKELTNTITDNIKRSKRYFTGYIKWLFLGILTGLICGFIGSLFHLSIEKVTELREEHSFILYLLPFAGLFIVFIYHTFKLVDIDGTNYVISSIRTDGRIPITMAFGIFSATILTHLFGGSAGREGAALQLGGSLGSSIGKIFKLDDKDMHVLVFCGMSAVFTSLFGTPMTAAIFVLEVISVGVIYHSVLLPCVFSSVTAFFVTKLMGFSHFNYTISGIPEVLPIKMISTIVLGVLCALVSILMCISMKQVHNFAKKIKNEYIRIAVGGVLIVIISLIVGFDYNGAGMNIAEAAFLEGNAKPYAFILKLILTVITIGFGFKGGEIVPSFFIGATFGCVMAPILGLDAGFGAAMGLVGVFCGVTNTPIASIMLSIELFGAKGLPYFALICVTCYVLSGYFSIYNSQIIVYDKLKSEFINRRTK